MKVNLDNIPENVSNITITFARDAAPEVHSTVEEPDEPEVAPETTAIAASDTSDASESTVSDETASDTSEESNSTSESTTDSTAE